MFVFILVSLFYFVLLFVTLFLAKNTKKNFIIQVFLVIIASFLVAINVRIFIQPNNILPGGVSGMSLIIAKLFTVESGDMVLQTRIYSIANLIINIPIFIFAFKKVGKRFTILSLIYLVSYSLIVNLIPYDFIMETFKFASYNLTSLEISSIAGLFSSFAGSIIYFGGFSSAGTAIISVYLMDKKGTNVSVYNFIINFIIVTAGTIIFKDLQIMVYTILYYLIESIILGYIYSPNKKVVVEITSPNLELISNILANNKNSFTVIKSSKNNPTEVYQVKTIIYYYETNDICNMIIQYDQEANINVYQIKKIFGKFPISRYSR